MQHTKKVILNISFFLDDSASSLTCSVTQKKSNSVSRIKKKILWYKLLIELVWLVLGRQEQNEEK